MLNRRALLAAPLLLAAPACAGERPAPMRVLTSFSILADIVKMVGDERVAVEALVGPGGDAHAFQPSPADAGKAAGAKLIVVNGLGFDPWMERLAAAAGAKDRIVVAARGVSARKGEDAHEGHAHASDLDPHAWQSVPNMRRYVETIRAALEKADPQGGYAGNATTYLEQLDALDAEIRAAVAALPPNRRKVVTTHDAFGYFAAEYGLTFLAPKGVSNEAEPSPRDLARIVRQIKADKIPAVFLENVIDPRLMERIAAETGARIGDKLYSDSLSAPDGPAPTYLAMMRHNIRELTKALAP
jgi:zinc/manganese transport system substrate-binding protein